MKKIFLATAFGLALTSMTNASAVVITFDDLPAPAAGGSVVPNGYSGLNWSNFYYLNGVTYGASGYQNGVVSPTNVAYNGWGSPASFFASATPFFLRSTYMTGAWNNGLTVTVTGSLNGVQKFSKVVVVNATGPTLVNFNWAGINQVNISTAGGVSAGFGGAGAHLAMDNLFILAFDPQALADSLPTITGVPVRIAQMSALALFGAHHRPLMDSGLVQKGSCFWATGDASHDSRANVDMTQAEVGACRDVANDRVRIGAGVGTNNSSQATLLGGSNKMNGQYLIGEVDYAPESQRWIASGTFYYGDWTGRITRNYMNGGIVDSSYGPAKANNWAFRARMDWKDMAHTGGFGLSPYAALTHIESRLNAYNEAGGGIPVQFGAQSVRYEELRAGVVAAKPLSDMTKLRLSAEAVQQFNGSASTLTAQAFGLTFTQPGTVPNRAWGRLGAEIDHRFSNGKSVLSTSLHAAAAGGDPTVTGSMSFKHSF